MFRFHRDLQEMAVIESLPLRQSFNFCYLQHVTTN